MSASPRPVRTVLFGNSFAARVQLPGLRWAGGAEVVGIAGHDAEKARVTAAEFDIPHATADWRELLALEPDLVLVSTPVDLHLPMTLAALAAGAAVLCEKPFALNVPEAEQMTQAAAGSPAWLDHELRWSPYLRELRRRVRKGDVGATWLATFEMFTPPAPGRARPWSWWFDAARGGGVLGALGSHMLDTLRWIFGDVIALRASLRVLTGTRLDRDGVEHPVTADEYAALELRHVTGAVSSVRTSTVLHHDRFFRLQVEGEQGCIRLDGADELSFARAGGDFEPLAVEAPYPTCSAMGLPEYGPFGRSFPLFARDVLAAVANGDEQLRHAATFEDGLAVQRVLDAARRSSRAPESWEQVR